MVHNVWRRVYTVYGVRFRPQSLCLHRVEDTGRQFRCRVVGFGFLV